MRSVLVFCYQDRLSHAAWDLLHTELSPIIAFRGLLTRSFSRLLRCSLLLNTAGSLIDIREDGSTGSEGNHAYDPGNDELGLVDVVHHSEN